MTAQPMDPDWLPFHPAPKSPDFALPDGAVDAHCHVFGPSPEFPFAPERKYTPCNAGKDALFALRDHLGFSRNVIVQATCHGKDNRAMVDACRASGDRARGVASVGADITEAELAEMHVAGVRGVRFNFVKRLVDATPPEGHVIINTGLMLERVTNGLIPPGMHRVVADPDQPGERISVVQFCHPAPWTMLTPLSSCISEENPQRFLPIRAADALDEVLWQINLFDATQRTS